MLDTLTTNTNIKLILIFGILLIILIFGVLIFIMLRSLFHSKKLSIGIGNIKLNTSNETVEIPDRRNIQPYMIFMERIIDCFEKICILKKDIWDIYAELKENQLDTYSTYFIQLERMLVDGWKKGYKKWCESENKIIPENFESTAAHLEYCLIIKGITEDRYREIPIYTNRNDLYLLKNDEWDRWKKRNRKKYTSIARSRFNDLYKPNVCKIPKWWHDYHIMRVIDPFVNELLNDMQDELKEVSTKCFTKIEGLEKKIDNYMTKVIIYKEFKNKG